MALVCNKTGDLLSPANFFPTGGKVKQKSNACKYFIPEKFPESYTAKSNDFSSLIIELLFSSVSLTTKKIESNKDALYTTYIALYTQRRLTIRPKIIFIHIFRISNIIMKIQLLLSLF